MKKILVCGMMSLFCISSFASSPLDLFGGRGVMIGKTSSIFGTQCVVEFNNDDTPLHDKINERVTVFKITNASFLKKLKGKLSEVERQIKKDNNGNESLTFFKRQSDMPGPFNPSIVYNFTAQTLAVFEGNGMLRLVINAEQLDVGKFKVKNFYVIQGRSTVLECAAD